MAHWRDSARRPRFYIIEGWGAFPMFIFLLHIQWWTFIVALSATIFFSVLERYGFTIPIFWRWLLCFLGGSRKAVRPWWQ